MKAGMPDTDVSCGQDDSTFSTVLFSCVTQYDLVVRNGLIVDGTGQRGYLGYVAITDGGIRAVGFVEG
jgi:hypothetical protein